MFYIAAKLLWPVLSPANLILVLAAAGAVSLFFKRPRRAGVRLLLLAGALLLVLGYSPAGLLLLTALEDRFPTAAGDPPPDVILVLGGGVEGEIAQAYAGLAPADVNAGRITAAVALARRNPAARVIFSGGRDEWLSGPGPAEADLAEAFLLAAGLKADRLGFERRSRDTFENAIFTRDLFPPQSEARWLLVTSAFHMPRAMGVFRAAGFPVVAWPVGRLTATGGGGWGNVSTGLRLSDVALREWLGLAMYWLAGRSGALFPAPASEVLGARMSDRQPSAPSPGTFAR